MLIVSKQDMARENGEMETKGLKTRRIGDKLRLISLPENTLGHEYFLPENHTEIFREGRTRIVESHPKGKDPRYFVVKQYEAPERVHGSNSLARLDPIGEARMQAELIKRLKGSPVTAATPLAIYAEPGASGIRHELGLPLDAKSAPRKLELVSELVPGIKVAEQVEGKSVIDKEGMRIDYEEPFPLGFIHKVLSSKGIIPLDLHHKNVLQFGSKYVIVDAKHVTVHPSEPSAEKWLKYRWIYLPDERKAVNLMDHVKVTESRMGGIQKYLENMLGFAQKHRDEIIENILAGERKRMYGDSEDRVKEDVNESIHLLGRAVRERTLKNLNELLESHRFGLKFGILGQYSDVSSRLKRAIDYAKIADEYKEYIPQKRWKSLGIV